KIFLVNLGEPRDLAAAVAFATNFFAAAGIEAFNHAGFETAQAAVDSFRASGCKIACVCAPLAVSTHDLMELAARLRDAGAAGICLAGREPEEAAMALLEVRVNELICARRDALAILQVLAVAALQQQQSYTQ
ncbi:MAG TPA: methylmalonyl-CoA mutase, partial [Methylocella sp.]|nr:methylmalonyl-CoA mutase [Methylocella sp.]